MRWKIKSTSVSENKSTGIKTTTKTKQFTVTIGEAVGVGKTAVGAVQAAAKSLKTLNKANPKAGLAPFASTASILANVEKSLEVYKKVMNVIEKITPIVQLVARGSGLWCSPGNAGDIAQIILGQVQKILIALVVTAISQLKDYIWNYEFVIKEIKETFEEPINKNIEELAKKVNKSALNDSFKNLANDAETNKYQDSLIAGISSGTLDLSDSIDWNNDSDTKWFSDAYITEYTDPESSTKRKLRGSIKNLGIQYSDDDGETWKQTQQLDGSWYCFAKIPNGNGYTYVAGSKDFIESIKDSTDTEWVDNKNYYYSDGENYQAVTKYYKENNNFDGKDKNDFSASKGIYFSTDNGITWQQTSVTNNINHICEFEEKVNYPPTLVASSDDFDGCFYSTDGETWTSTYDNDKWFNVKAQDTTQKRIKRIGIVETAVTTNLGVGVGNIFKNETVVNFKITMNGLTVQDGREEETVEFYDNLAELIAQGLDGDELYEGLIADGYTKEQIYEMMGVPMP